MKISDVMTINIPNASGSFLSLLHMVSAPICAW